MSVFWLIPIIIGMHIFGSCVLAAFMGGPSMFFAGIILSIFGWYLLPFEALGASAIYEFYKPSLDQKIHQTLIKGSIIGLTGAIIFAPFIPKEEGSEIIGWVVAAFAGCSSAMFAFTSVHVLKLKAIKKCA